MLAMKCLRELNTSKGKGNTSINTANTTTTFDDVMKSLVYGYLQSQGLVGTMTKMCEETGLSNIVLEGGSFQNRVPLKYTGAAVMTAVSNWPSKKTTGSNPSH